MPLPHFKDFSLSLFSKMEMTDKRHVWKLCVCVTTVKDTQGQLHSMKFATTTVCKVAMNLLLEQKKIDLILVFNDF